MHTTLPLDSSPSCHLYITVAVPPVPNLTTLRSHIFFLLPLLFTHLSCFSQLLYLHSWNPLVGCVYKNILLTFTPFRLFTQLLASFCHVVTNLFCVFCLFRFAPSVCAVRVVEPLNLGSPGMPSGHMTSPCVMTVPNYLLKVGVKYVYSFTLCNVVVK